MAKDYKFFKLRKIMRHTGEVYMYRLYIFQCPLFGLKLHKICLSDDDCVHDHPWSFISFIIKNGYWEKTEVPFKKYWSEDTSFFTIKNLMDKGYHFVERRDINEDEYVWTVFKRFDAGSLLWRPAEHRHKLEIDEGKPAYTLVLNLKVRRKWGFWSKAKGWIHWKRFNSTQVCE